MTHLVDLQQIQLGLISDKIQTLQQQTINLLQGEKQLLEQKVAEIKEKIAALPEKWQRENLLLLKKEMGAHMLTAMTRLFESKNLNQKLYQASSSHLDLSLPPLRPRFPFLLVYSCLAAFISCALYYLCRLSLLLIKGFPISHANAKHYGMSSYGILTAYCDCPFQELGDRDIETLRGLSHFIATASEKSSKAACIGLLTGRNPDYSANLAELLSLSGAKVLLVRCADRKIRSDSLPGLWQYLGGEEKQIPIRKLAHFDELTSGSTSRHVADQLKHPQFLQLLSELKEQYDIVLIHSNAPIERWEAYAFTQIVDRVIITTRFESLKDLARYREFILEQRLGLACLD